MLMLRLSDHVLAASRDAVLFRAIQSPPEHLHNSVYNRAEQPEGQPTKMLFRFAPWSRQFGQPILFGAFGKRRAWPEDGVPRLTRYGGLAKEALAAHQTARVRDCGKLWRSCWPQVQGR